MPCLLRVLGGTARPSMPLTTKLVSCNLLAEARGSCHLPGERAEMLSRVPRPCLPHLPCPPPSATALRVHSLPNVLCGARPSSFPSPSPGSSPTKCLLLSQEKVTHGFQSSSQSSAHGLRNVIQLLVTVHKTHVGGSVLCFNTPAALNGQVLH